MPGPGFHGARIQGARKYQQDAFRDDSGEASRAPSIIVLADGMGGHAGGEEASRIAVDVFLESFQLSRSMANVPERLRRAVESANAAILDEAEARPELEGMGATLVAVVQTPAGMYHISVGDSPLWRFGAEGLVRVNADHSMADVFRQMAEKGEMTAEQAARHPQRNQLQSVLGEEDLELVDCPAQPMTFASGDLLLAASDGLQTLTDQEIEAILRANRDDADRAVAALLASVEAKGSARQDNATAYVWRPVVPGAAPQRGLKSSAVDPRPRAVPGRRGPLLAIGVGVGLILGVVLTLVINRLHNTHAVPPKPTPHSRQQPLPAPPRESAPKTPTVRAGASMSAGAPVAATPAQEPHRPAHSVEDPAAQPAAKRPHTFVPEALKTLGAATSSDPLGDKEFQQRQLNATPGVATPAPAKPAADPDRAAAPADRNAANAPNAEGDGRDGK